MFTRPRLVFYILLLCIGLLAANASAQIPNSASFVIKLQSIAHPYVSTVESPVIIRSADRGGIGLLGYSALTAVHGIGAVAGYNKLTGIWGKPNGSFHLKNETSDYLAYNDEVSHMFVSYKLTQALTSAYGVIGLKEKKARRIGAIEAALIMTAVEFPVDAFNPSQGMGVTDLIADYAGVGLAILKTSDSRFSEFDMKLSVKSLGSNKGRVLGYDTADYDNYIYWLTYSVSPVVGGIGYSTTRNAPREPRPQVLLGIGTTIPDLIEPLFPGAAKVLEPLELYFFNFHVGID